MMSSSNERRRGAHIQTKLPGSWIESDDSTNSKRCASEASLSRRPKGSYDKQARAEHPKKSHNLTRDELCDFADLTLQTLDEGSYVPPGSKTPYNLAEKIIYTNENTKYIPPDDEEMGGWATAELKTIPQDSRTRTMIKEYSTVYGARWLNNEVQQNPEIHDRRIGVLNFASAKKAGGGFINGAQAQEESLARSSTLYPSLLTDEATQFYAHYVNDPNNPYYTHAMVYSPNVVFFRNDKGDWKKPIKVDVLTSAAVNAGEVRQNIRWAEDMRLLRARVKAAEASRARAFTREAERRRQREERRRQIFAEERAHAAELRRKKEKRQSEPEQLPMDDGSAGAEPDKMDVDTTNPTEAAESITQQQLSFNDSGPSTAEQVSQLETNPVSDVSQNSVPPPVPNTAKISPPRTPSPEVVPVSTLLAQAESDINLVMRERIGRLLYLFYKSGARHLVLGSFGTGVFQNKVETVAQMFHEFIVQPTGRFYNVFDTVLFAILGKPTIADFRKVFKNTIQAVSDDEDLHENEDTSGSTDEPQDGKDDEESANMGSLIDNTEVVAHEFVDNTSSTSTQVPVVAQNNVAIPADPSDRQDAEQTQMEDLHSGHPGEDVADGPPTPKNTPPETLNTTQQHNLMPRAAPI